MFILQVYLLLGLVIHKIVWESLRQNASEKPVESASASLTLVKMIKIGILVAVVIQIWLPGILPILIDAFPIRVIGTFVYTVGLATAIAARFQLGENWANIETGQVLKSQKVVARGIYAYVRHPIYIGDLLLLTGLELALNSWLVIGVLVLAPVVLLKAIKEERMLIEELSGYEAYCRSSKRFIPFVF